MWKEPAVGPAAGLIRYRAASSRTRSTSEKVSLKNSYLARGRFSHPAIADCGEPSTAGGICLRASRRHGRRGRAGVRGVDFEAKECIAPLAVGSITLGCSCSFHVRGSGEGRENRPQLRCGIASQTSTASANDAGTANRELPVKAEVRRRTGSIGPGSAHMRSPNILPRTLTRLVRNARTGCDFLHRINEA